SEMFAGLEPASIERISLCREPVSFESGREVCREGEAGHDMFIITAGRVSVSSNMGWGQREIDKLGADAVFGEMALISNENRSATVRATENTECLRLGKASFDALLDADTSIAQCVAKVMTKRLSALVHRTSNELLGAYRALLFSIADLTESRDPETGAHLERTRNYCVLLSEKLSVHARYKDQLSQPFLEGIYQVSPLHDVGKVAIPDSILLKPGHLDDGEFEIMKSHTKSGAAAFDKVLKESDTDLFRIARNICLHHHERWDGSGYPVGLAGEAIPLEARIMALADSYDAILSKRIYKPALSLETARAEIRRVAGTQFDPFMAEIMLENIGKFEEIRSRFRDE
ncbi:MAG: HD domain-containing phosphohydrolase, partial [Spirochaetota bacterium]